MFFALLAKISLVFGVVLSVFLLLCATLFAFAPKILLYIVIGGMILLGIYLLFISIVGISLLKNTDRQ